MATSESSHAVDSSVTIHLWQPHTLSLRTSRQSGLGHVCDGLHPALALAPSHRSAVDACPHVASSKLILIGDYSYPGTAIGAAPLQKSCAARRRCALPFT